MKLIKLSLLVGVVILFAVACNQPPSQPTSNAPGAAPAATTATPDEFTVGRAIFVKDCVACHGEKGQGGTVKLEDGKRLKVPSLREGHALDHPDSEFVEQIEKGGDGMPAFKDKLRPDLIDALVGFIRHEFQGGRTKKGGG